MEAVVGSAGRYVEPLLAKFGFEVTALPAVKDALAEIRTAKFDVLLSDLNVLEGNDGFSVIEEMRRLQPGCINFILTGFPASESFQRGVEHGVAYYFIKPVDVEEMVTTIKGKLGPRYSPPTNPEVAPRWKLKYSWQRPVLEAVMESRPDRLSFRLNAAERAISARLCDPNSPDVDESAALRDALRTLRILFPDRSKPHEESGKKRDIA